MKRIHLVIALLPFLAPAAFAQTCGSTNVVNDPPVFQWTQENGYETGTLVMDTATLTIDGETLTTRVYAQEGAPLSIPGPTLVMESGKKYVLQFQNLLPHQPLSGEHNTFTDPNVTNVHTHGLHISGESPADDVTRAFEGRRGGDYVYEIPADHMAGTFWYHAHHHGSTFLQVSSGAFGLIIIEDPLDTTVPANVSAMEERHLIFGFLEPGNAAGTGGDSLISGSFSSGWTVNGTVNGDICVPPNTWQHWRMLVADQDARLVDLEIGDGCEVELMARDGVWRTEVPKAVPDGTLTLTGASRADVAVRCNSSSTISVGGVQVGNILVDDNAPSNLTPGPYANSTTTDTWMPARPWYLRDLRGSTVGNSEAIRMGARTVLGRKFDKNEPNLIQGLTGVQEWSLNGATNHPFHLHVYHVQVQNDCGPYEAGEFYDVIAGNCDLRFDLSEAAGAFDGRTIFHCHILQHEDQGAMGWLRVDGGLPPPTFPNETFSDYYVLGDDPPSGPTAPSGLNATPITSSQIDLAWTDNSGDEDSFAIERSLDGSNFAQIATVPTDTESYPDAGLDPSTTYYYKVAAVNGNGTTYSGIASATTLTVGGTPTGVEVASISVTTVSLGRGLRQGSATIVVSDNLGDPVNGALVDGYFIGDLSGSAIDADTADDDTVTVLTDDSAKKVRNLQFCVTSVTHSTLAEFSGEVCGSL